MAIRSNFTYSRGYMRSGCNYSFLMCLVWTGMGAVDVAFTEATVGAGVSTVFFVAAIYHTTRRTTD